MENKLEFEAKVKLGKSRFENKLKLGQKLGRNLGLNGGRRSPNIVIHMVFHVSCVKHPFVYLYEFIMVGV